MCMCVFRLECVLCVSVSMSSCCPSACSHGSVCLCVYVCVRGEGERGRGRIMKVNGSQMDCFSSFLRVVNDVRRVTSL